MNSLVQLRFRKARPVKELVVISGKGGTGKTSLVASFAALRGNAVLADCDVDASNLHLVTAPRIVHSEPFTGGKRAFIDVNLCQACGQCEELCRYDAIDSDPSCGASLVASYRVDPLACEGCGVCAWFCPVQAIQMRPVVSGAWFVSETRFGPMVHARLGAAAENSGKLVSLVRARARQIAAERGIDLVLIDGSPGIGCPVIASITGADLAVIVTEPTPSGLHDMERVTELTRHFGIPAALCMNKWDLNAGMSRLIETKARERGVTLAGRIRYDQSVTEAQVEGKAVVECGAGGGAEDIGEIWKGIRKILAGSDPDADQCRSQRALADVKTEG
ncbi:MAG: ATP-binding protein [Terracidiphilus sp.]